MENQILSLQNHSFFSFSWIAILFVFAYGCDESKINPDDPLPVGAIEIEAIQKTSRELYQATSEEFKNNNFVISPLSIQLALYMVYNGADGETKQEIGQMLHVMDGDLESLNRKVKNLLDYLTNLIEKGHLDIYNVLFYDGDRITLADEYVKRLKTYFNVYKSELNFGDPSAVESINGWVKEKTYDKIREVIQTISDQEALFLLNALYLKADWVSGFSVGATSERSFLTIEGNEISIPTMHSVFTVDHILKDGKQIVRMALADSALFVYLIMPEQTEQLPDLINSEIVSEIWSNTLDFQTSRVMFQMPKVETKTHVSLNSALQSLGMESAFNPQKADLHLMGTAANKLYITRSFHDVYLKMDEKGVEGAAVTTIGVGTTSLPPSILIDKPFMYLIVDQELGLPLFIGQFTGVEADK